MAQGLRPRRDRERWRTYRTRDLILGYYDAFASGALYTWLGPDDKREATRHSMETRPEGMDGNGRAGT